MKKHKPYHNFFRKVSAVSMIAALIWLTVSIPFVFRYQQEVKKAQQLSEKNNPSSNNNEDNNPFANTTEEKTSSVNTLSEEYLHQHDEHKFYDNAIITRFNRAAESLYLAFHGELLSPPPDMLLS